MSFVVKSGESRVLQAEQKYSEYKAKINAWARLFEEEHGAPPSEADCQNSSTWTALNEKARFYKKALVSSSTGSASGGKVDDANIFDQHRSETPGHQRRHHDRSSSPSRGKSHRTSREKSTRKGGGTRRHYDSPSGGRSGGGGGSTFEEQSMRKKSTRHGHGGGHGHGGRHGGGHGHGGGGSPERSMKKGKSSRSLSRGPSLVDALGAGGRRPRAAKGRG